MSYKKRKRVPMISMGQVMSEYGLSRNLIDLYLPEPRVVENNSYKNAAPTLMWRRADVEQAIKEHKGLKKAVEKHRYRMKKAEEKKREKERRDENAVEFLQQFSPDVLIEEGRSLNRHFTLHVGPTNSGKTYAALQPLKGAENGVYLGPLRLLALEVSENMNFDGYPCTLLTGEEFIDVPGSRMTASTIELCDYAQDYDVAVIDEAQLITDSERGHHWLTAICLVNAADIHICLAPEAEQIIIKIIEALGAEYTIRRHERLVPLKYTGIFHNIRNVQPGDALIAFSRKKVLQLAAALEEEGIKASVVYGALPPASRREEVRRFSSKETVAVVATDAIGMGISLPIRRVIFMETMKYDGVGVRPLTMAEIKQIAGRAGRFGKYDLGEVLHMEGTGGISYALKGDVPPIESVILGFPSEALDYDYPLADMLRLWDEMPDSEFFKRTDMQEAELLLKALGKTAAKADKKLLYSLITCPVDTKNDTLVAYWAECCKSIIDDIPVQRPWFEEETLTDCELKYRAYDIYHQLLRRIGVEDDCLEEKAALSEKINEFLKDDKTEFLKKCRICGRKLRVTDRYDICDRCFRRRRF